MSDYKMDPEVKAKWVAALRSGDYRQAKGQLYDGNGYCCLGVLCEVLGQEKRFVEDEDNWFFGSGADMQAYILPNKVCKLADLMDADGILKVDPLISGSALSYLNDSKGLDFTEIADLIEQHL